MASRKKKIPQPPVLVAPPSPKPYIPLTPISEETKRKLVDDAERYWSKEAAYYGYDQPRPERVTQRIQMIHTAPDYETAISLAEKIRSMIQITILGAWASGTISGPVSVRSLEKKAASAESLAKMLAKKGKPDQAQAQRLRAEEIRQQIQVLIRS